MLADFRAYLDARKIAYTRGDLEANREPVSRLIIEERSCGRCSARARRVGAAWRWDPQVKKALELVPRAELLLKDPQTLRGRARRASGGSPPRGRDAKPSARPRAGRFDALKRRRLAVRGTSVGLTMARLTSWPRVSASTT